MISPEKILQKSILIVAHPDDEALWFSSILDRIDRIILCYFACKTEPGWTRGRAKTLSQYPLKNISNLQLDETEVFDDRNFHSPILNAYGLQIYRKKDNEKHYIMNYHKLYTLLEEKLSNYRNVFTHNPWGEYGNEEHIQVFAVVKKLQESMRFDLWFPNYVSNKSFPLMTRYISNNIIEFVTFKTNKLMSESIKNLYTSNGCWTWDDEWEWPDEETFIRHDIIRNEENKYRKLIPINFMNVNYKQFSKQKPKMFQKLVNKILLKNVF